MLKLLMFGLQGKISPHIFEPLRLVWLGGEVVSVVDADLHHGGHVLEGSQGHDSSQYRVSSEQNKL